MFIKKLIILITLFTASSSIICMENEATRVPQPAHQARVVNANNNPEWIPMERIMRKIRPCLFGFLFIYISNLTAKFLNPENDIAKNFALGFPWVYLLANYGYAHRELLKDEKILDGMFACLEILAGVGIGFAIPLPKSLM